MLLLSHTQYPLHALAAVLVLKGLASALSLGSGFRGGLYSTSLFLGLLSGALTGGIGIWLGFLRNTDLDMMMLVGMASFGAAVVGAPLSMALLAIEVTQSHEVAGPVLLGVTVATLTVRHLFGYSFATWRFHQRGETILSAQDIGWLRETTVRQLMSSAITIVPASMPYAEVLNAIGPGKVAVAVDNQGACIGILERKNIANQPVAAARSQPCPKTAADLLTHADALVEADGSIGALMPIFENLETETLIVVEDLSHRRPVGFVTEAFALKHYRRELEARQRELFGI